MNNRTQTEQIEKMSVTRQNEQGRPSRQRYLFIAIVFTFWFSTYIYVPILSPYIEHLGASYTFLGLVLGVYGLMQILLRVPLGIGSDYLRKRRPFIMAGLVASVVSGFTFALTDQLGWALLARAIAGISASTWVVYTVAFSGYYRDHELTKAMSIIQFTTVIAQLASMLISGYLVDTWNWHVPFVLGGIVALMGIGLSLFLKESKHDASVTRMSVQDLMPVMRDPLLVRMSLLAILANCTLFITMFGYTPNQALALGASKNDLAWLTLSFMLPHAIATIFAGKYLVRWFGERAIMVIGFAGSAVFTFCIPMADTFVWLCVTQIFNGLAQGFIFPILLGKAVENIAPSKRATAMGFYQAVYAVGMFLGPFIAGWVSSSWGLAGGFRFAAFVALFGTGVALYWMKDRTPSVDRAQEFQKGA